MNIVLVSANNFQPYILDNIEHLIRLGNKSIYILTNECFFDKFDKFKNEINLIKIEDLQDSYDFNSKTSLDKETRNGFWMLTSSRFFYIYEFMKKYDIKNIIHLENDVLIYYNTEILINKVNSSYMYVPFDSYDRNIASIVYVPNHIIFKEILDNYNFSENDMYNFKNIMNITGKVKNLPIFTFDNNSLNEEYNFVTKNYNSFHYIFDAAAIGQYLGGVDPANNSNDTVGFVNETCIIKYNNYVINWKTDNNIKKPFLIKNEEEIPIFNLHIHCKNLRKFMIYENYFDIVIPLGPNDHDLIIKQIEHTKKYINGYRNIYIVPYDSSINIDGCITISEDSFPFSKNNVNDYIGVEKRNGWYLQQLLKLYAGFVIPNILERYLVIDSDTYFFKETEFVNYNKKCFYSPGTEYWRPYFEHMKKLHPSFERVKNELSGISHHMIFEKKYIKELFDMVQIYHKKGFWIVFLENVSNDYKHHSGASEYELYFNFLLKYHPNEIEIRNLQWANVSNIINIENREMMDYVSCHSWMRQ